MAYIWLRDVVVLITLSLAAVYLCRRVAVPGIVGFLIAGAVAGPHALGLVEAPENVELLAEIGVIALLFTIGLESSVSLGRLWHIRRHILIGGTVQVFGTGIIAALVALQLGLPANEAVIVGCLLSLSSTAIVLGLLQSRDEISTFHGQISLAILIYQDIIVIPMVLMVPMLVGDGGAVGAAVMPVVLRTVVVAAGAVVLVRWVVPPVMTRFAESDMRELFLLAIVVFPLGIALVTELLGLSLVLGAFLAGLILSESEQSHRALGSTLPFRDLFTSFFFISVGMMLDPAFVGEAALLIIGAAVALVVFKSVLACGSALLLGYPLRIAVVAGMILAQVGEFSFLVFQAAVEEDLLPEVIRQLFLTVAVIAMMLTPLLVKLAPRVADALASLSWLGALASGEVPAEVAEEDDELLIIAGFGFTGRLIARAADIKYVVIEMRPETVRGVAVEDEPIFRGDATHETVLERAGIERASVLAVALSDFGAARRTVELATRMNPACHIIVRTESAREVSELIELGANEVISREFEASIEMFARVLHACTVSDHRVVQMVWILRGESYDLLSDEDREIEIALKEDCAAPVWHKHIAAIEVCEDSPLANTSPEQMKLRREHGVTVIVVRRDGKSIPNPPGTFVMRPGDTVVVMGEPETLEEFAAACASDEQ